MLCNGKTAMLAAIYPFDLCRAILTGLKAQMECDGRMSHTSVGLHIWMGSDLEDEVPLNMLEAGNSYGELLKLKVENEEVFHDGGPCQGDGVCEVRGLMDQEANSRVLVLSQDWPPSGDGEVCRHEQWR